MKSCTIRSFIPILWLVTLTLAEPPVENGYPSARSSHNHDHDDHHHDHHGSDHQHGLPSSGTARNAPSDGYDYSAPNARSSSRQSRFPPATVRVNFNQRFSSAASRNSDNARHQEHSAPNTRSGISQEHGPPADRFPSQEYGVPSVVSARTLSTQYGMPDARSTPSQEYGIPVVAARSNQQSHSQSTFRSAQPSQPHDHLPASGSQFLSDSEFHTKSAPSARSTDVSDSYKAPESHFDSHTAPSSHDTTSSRSFIPHSIPSARNFNSEEVDSISQTNGTPDHRGLDQTYEAPNARSESQDHVVPSSRANFMTSAMPSSFASASSRSSPSSTYLPASRSAAPSEQYGLPEQLNSSSQGYDYTARARALEELQNQEPASYDFGYQIEDQESGSDFGHTETREAGKAQGSYFVVRPDGTKQIVEYEADERGFRPRISVEPAAASARGGHDHNAQDSGPY